VDMSNAKDTMTELIVTELIVTGYGDVYTVFLARAALARLQEELGMTTDDVAMVLRGADGNVALQQTLNRHAGRNESSTFWETIADQLFAPESSPGSATGAESENRATVGIDPAFMSRVVNQLQLCESALLVRARGQAQREKVVGLLQGFVRKVGTGGSSSQPWITEIH
jgi:uncharacterized membrane protein